MPRFIWTGLSVAVTADSLDDASRMLEDLWAGDEWNEVAPGVNVFAPSGPPGETEDDDAGPECICPPDLLARGGFRGGCPVHG